MSAYAAELRQCLGLVLGAEPPEPEHDALVFFKPRGCSGRSFIGSISVEDQVAAADGAASAT